MSTQEQQVRQHCNAIAAQVFLIAKGQQGTRSSAATAERSSGVQASAARGAPTANTSERPQASRHDDRAEALRRLSEAVVRDAMTLYRLCHRPGGDAIVIVPASSSGGGGGGAAGEAAYCICAVIMAREASLWASMARRAQLLRSRKPTLCFAAPVVVPPVVVKDVAKFYMRSRHLVHGSGGGRRGSAASTAGATGTAVAGALSDQQAEAVAATFFFKTMSAAERQRRPEVFRVDTHTVTPAVGGTALTAPRGKPAVAAAESSSGSSSGLPGRAGVGDGVHATPAMPSLLSTLSAAMSRKTEPGPRHGPSPHAASSSFSFYMDDWAGWHGGGGIRHPISSNKSPTTDALQGELGGAVGGVDGGWLSRSSSSDRVSAGEYDSSDASRTVPASERGDGADVGSGHASAGAGHRRHTRRKAAATDTAVLERLYHLATSADAAMASAEQSGGEEETNDDGTGAFSHHSGGGAAAAMSGMPASFFTSGKGMGLVSLAAMTVQVRDALHWGRLMALVQCPILFRGLSAPPLLDSGAPATTSRGSLATSEALTAASMARLNNLLGSSYTSTLASLLSSSCATPASPVEQRAAVSDFILTYGFAVSIFCPSRLRASSLLPRPPSVVTAAFLWSRLLICGAWLQVYADSLLDDESPAPSSANDDSSTASSLRDARCDEQRCYAKPRVRSTPLVQETVAYCVAVVKEARAMGADMASEGDASARTAASDHGGSTVCCPVCDRLVKEQQTVLWWSTLREDRARLREQVCTLLENCSATEAEARVAASMAADGMREGGGGRPYAAPQLSGSGAAGERVAELQERWATYIMGVTAPSASAVAASSDTLAASQKVPAGDDRCGAAPGDETDTTAPGGALPDAAGRGHNGDEATRTLWAALAQRVAAATDLCTFLSTHPISSGDAAIRHASVLKHTADCQRGFSSFVVQRSRRRDGVAATGVGVKRRRLRSTSASSSDDESESSVGSSDDSEAYPHPRRHTHGNVGAAAQPSQPCRLHQQRPTAKRRSCSRDGSELVYGDDEESTAATTARLTHPGTFPVSRHAHELTEEWARLLRRCGWVNAAPPRPLTSPSSPTAVPSPSASASSSSATRLYEQWAASLTQPSSTSSLEQAAGLRRRLSRYHLDDMVRVLVLGRGGQRSQYAALMFGADALPSNPVSSRVQGLRRTGKPAQQRGISGNGAPASRQAALAEGMEVPFSTPPRRETSMSLLQGDDNNAPHCAVGCVHKVDDPLERDSSLLAAGHEGEGVGQQSARHSPSPPALTSPAVHHQRSSPLPPRCSFSKSQLSPSAKEGVWSPSTRQSALPSIPLHVSPLRRHGAAVACGGVAGSDTDKRQERVPATARKVAPGSPTEFCAIDDPLLLLCTTAVAPAAATRKDKRDESPHPMCSSSSSSRSSGGGGGSVLVANAAENGGETHAISMWDDSGEESTAESHDSAVARSQLRAQQAAIRALLHFRPLLPPLREEDAVLECGSCFSLFHQSCIAPAQRDLMGQIFLCHTCRLRWAVPPVGRDGEGGLVSQVEERRLQLRK